MGNFDRDRGDRFGGSNDRGGFGGGNRGGRDFGGGRGGRTEMFRVICDECGKSCEVPFKPTGDKPVFCSECFGGGNDRGGRDFGRDRGGRGGRDDRGGRDRFEEKRMYDAVCDQCGKDCELPFRPTSDKPVFCSDCFVKEDKPKKLGADYKADFDALNAKLDMIIAHLGLNEAKKAPVKIKLAKVTKEIETTEEEISEEIEAPVKVKAPKKTTKKIS